MDGRRRVTVLFSLLFCVSSAATALSATRQPGPSSCAEWRACRDLAETARAEGDYERFHDLAWRAVQTRGRRDPELLILLARAQSLSGRPHDALVTLQRLAVEQRVAYDVSSDDDFRRVRALPGWPEVEALTKEAAAAGAASGPPDAPAAPTAPIASHPSGTSAPVPGATSPSPVIARRLDFVEVARFSAPPFEPGGLAYDAVSRRFVIGNLPERKLTIVAEGSNRSATLSGDAAHLLDVQAIAIDRAEGDLWVASASRGEDGEPASQVAKLQLISGRRLRVFSPEPADAPTRFVDLALNHGNGVLVLDAERPRLFQIKKNGETIARARELPAGRAASLAPGAGGVVYVAYADKLLRADLRAREAPAVRGERGRDIAGLRRIRWHDGSLVGTQETGDGGTRLVRIRLSRGGTRITAMETLDPEGSEPASAAALDLLGDHLYYLVRGPDGPAIRRIDLK